MDAVRELSDAELLSRHKDGDDRAFGELARRHRERLWAVAIRALGDSEEASDALQDAFLQAFRGAHKFRGDSAVTTWLHRIVVNACLDRIRRKVARPMIPVGDDANLDSMSRDPYKGTSPDSTSRSDASLDVHSALEKLPADQRAALVLVDMLGYAVDEVAAILDTKPGTVKSRCARGRARLVPHLQHLRNPEASQDVTSQGGGGRRS